MPTPFSKYSGCGNDFILIDNRQLHLLPSKQAITRLCHRQQGIGADGLIFLEASQSSNASYRMRIFNADGSEAEMCGNGLRCLAQYIRSLEKTADCFAIETMHQRMEISILQDLISVSMPPPSKPSLKKLSISENEVILHCLDTGVPHAVLFVDDLEKNNLFSLAPAIRFHKEFHPKGTNVNYAKILPDQSVAIRTYERGVEQETLACGTGAVAVAIASANAYQIPAPIKIHTRSGDCLHINFQGTSSFLTHLVMTGPAIKIFEGSTDLEMFGFQLKSSAPIQ